MGCNFIEVKHAVQAGPSCEPATKGGDVVFAVLSHYFSVPFYRFLLLWYFLKCRWRNRTSPLRYRELTHAGSYVLSWHPKRGCYVALDGSKWPSRLLLSTRPDKLTTSDIGA